MALWTPAEIDTNLWLDATDADTITESGGYVTGWDDKSGNDRHAVPVAGVVEVASSEINSLDTIETPTSGYLALPSLGSFTEVLVLAVVKAKSADSLGSDSGIWHIGTHSDNNHYPYSGSIYDGTGSTARKTVGAPSRAANLPNIISVSSAANDWEYFLNGNSEFSTTSSTVAVYTAPLIGKSSGSYYLDGYWGEVVILDDVSQREIVEGYLAWKWGLEDELPGGHPYEFHAPKLPSGETTLKLTIPSGTVSSDQTNIPATITLNSSCGTGSFDATDIFATLVPLSVDDDFTGTDGDAPNDILWDNITEQGEVDIQGNSAQFRGNVWDDITLNSNFKVSGDFIVKIPFDLVTVQASEDFIIQITYNIDADNNGYFRRRYSSGAGTYYAKPKFGGVTQSAGSATTTDTTGILMWQRSGTTLSAHYWNGSSFTQLSSWSGVSTDDVIIAIQCYPTAGYDTVIDVDSFTLTSGTVTWPDKSPFYKKLILTDASDNQLFCEVEQFDEVNEKATLHVKVPTVSSSVDTVLTLDYTSTNADNSPSSIIAKSVVLDMADNWGDVEYMGIRSIEFTLNGSVITMTSGFTADVTSEYSSSYAAAFAFNTSLAKIGGLGNTSWESATNQITNQRLIIVFDTPLEFDGITVNNLHTGGGLTARGAKNVVITASDDTITSVVYEDTITNGTVLFDGVFTQHINSNVADDKVLLLSSDITGFIGEAGDIPAQQVWDSNFAAVYHMAQDPSGSTDSILDSTSNENHGTPTGTFVTGDLVDADVGKAIDFDGTSYINCGNSVTMDGMQTVETNYYEPTGTPTYGGLVCRYVNNTALYMLAVIPSENSPGFWNNGNTMYGATDDTGVAEWHNRAYTNTGTAQELFRDGASDATASVTIATTAVDGGTLYLGGYWYSSAIYEFAGKLSEVRISNVVRSDDWISVTNLSLTDSLFAVSVPSVGGYYYTELIQPYSLLSAIFYTELVQPYAIMDDPIWTELTQPYGFPIAVVLDQPYTDVVGMYIVLDQYYKAAPEYMIVLDQPYTDVKAYYVELKQPYDGPVLFMVELNQPYALMDDPIFAELIQPYEVKEHTDFLIELRQPYALLTESGIITPESDVTVNGEEVKVTEFNFDFNFDQYVGQCDLSFATEQTFDYQDEIVIYLSGVYYRFLVTDFTEELSAVSSAFRVEGYSKAILMDLPYSSELTDEDEEDLVYGTASEICNRLAAIHGQSVIWELNSDPPQTTSTYQISGKSPLSAIRDLVRELRGRLQSDPDGQLRAVPLYFVDTNLYDVTIPEYEITSVEDIITLASDADKRNGYNKFIVSDDATTNGYQLEAEEVSPSSFKIKAYKTPWSSLEPTLRTSELSGVLIIPLGIEYYQVEEPEVIEIVAGEGQVTNPIYSIEHIDYDSRINLGDISFKEDGTITTTEKAETLLTITYTTIYWAWACTNADSEQVQFILETP